MTVTTTDNDIIPIIPDDEPLFGDALQRIRRSRHISQAELARRIDVNHSYISRLESGQRAPSLDLIARIEAHLDLDDQECRLLRRGAGYLRTVEALVLADPVMMMLARALNDPAIPREAREAFRAQVVAMVEYAGGYVPAGGDQ